MDSLVSKTLSTTKKKVSKLFRKRKRVEKVVFLSVIAPLTSDVTTALPQPSRDQSICCCCCIIIESVCVKVEEKDLLWQRKTEVADLVRKSHSTNREKFVKWQNALKGCVDL